MLFELSIIPIGRSSHLSDEIAEALKEIEASELPYRLTPTVSFVIDEAKRKA